MDGTDNFEARYAINRACVHTATPLVSGAAIRFEGQLSVFDFRRDNAPCYRCLYPHLEDSDDEFAQTCSGVLAPLVGVIGSLQATEAIKLITGVGTVLHEKLLLVDLLNGQWRSVNYRKDPNCPECANA